ncbi:hypothetical protein [Pedobacter frigidisoli]|uniref:hypothetical protein n=1 Tax=Pedobacter frigidisoli TaxID=2530455 RepID=UPI00292DAD66|nr:hypothetical protein [Pedobacter frigidisoli]
MQKCYYLPNWRAACAGAVVILVGLGLSAIGFIGNRNRSAMDTLLYGLLDFHSVSAFIVSLILLACKIGFVGTGVYYIWNSQKIIRAKIDEKGLHYKAGPISKYGAIFFLDTLGLNFIPFKEITDIRLVENKLLGDEIVIITRSKKIDLTTLTVLSQTEKEEIVKVIGIKILSIK